MPELGHFNPHSLLFPYSQWGDSIAGMGLGRREWAQPGQVFATTSVRVSTASRWKEGSESSDLTNSPRLKTRGKGAKFKERTH